MTDDRNPGLQALFDEARPADTDGAFVERVMTEIERDRRRTMLGWLLAGLLLVPLAWWLTDPIIGVMNLTAELLPDSLIEIETTWLAALAAPINSIAGIAGLAFLLAWRLFWKLRS